MEQMKKIAAVNTFYTRGTISIIPPFVYNVLKRCTQFVKILSGLFYNNVCAEFFLGIVNLVDDIKVIILEI